jgi:hypothetical protein
MQVLSLITSFSALRQALLREESEKILSYLCVNWDLKETY